MISFNRAIPLLVVTGLLVALSPLAGCNRAHADGEPRRVEAMVLNKQIEAGTAPLIVDVRTAEEFAAGHVPGALNIPYDEIKDRSAEIISHKGKPVVLYCRSGRRSGIAAETLAGEGFTDLGFLVGDMPGWEKAGFSVAK